MVDIAFDPRSAGADIEGVGAGLKEGAEGAERMVGERAEQTMEELREGEGVEEGDEGNI